ncbi:myc-family transcription factor [Scheffersomyces amazonensis]|uniref:myc-family transcription factor n=1 Tax=Scheffersomyces amazonensis TaxID=1078765 RepID=UPI00315E000A
MDSSVWNTFSPGQTGQTPGKSPYYHDHLQSHPSQNQPNQSNQPNQPSHESSSTHHSTPSAHPFQQTPLQPHLTTSTTPGSNFTDTEQMFLHQLEQNLYEAAAVHHHHHHHHHHQLPSNSHSTDTTPNSHGGGDTQSTSTNHSSSQSHLQSGVVGAAAGIPPPPPSQYEFGIENINFIIPEDLNFDTDPNHESSAFPPSHLPPTQTPSLLAANKSGSGPTSVPSSTKNTNTTSKNATNSSTNPSSTNSNPSSSSGIKDEKMFASPILPGQNEKSYNNQHYYHKQKLNEHQGSGGAAPQQHVRPDAVFTPLVSPAVTPLDSQIKSGVATGSGSSYGHQPPVSIAFEPLTSPALNAQPSGIHPNASNNSSNSNRDRDDRRRSSSSVFGPVDETPATMTTTHYKRRTPHGTPILSGNSSTATKYSPSIKGKNGVFRNTSGAFENLPESSLETGEMLPPSSVKRMDFQGNNSNNSNNNNSNNNNNGNSANGSATGTPLMGFTMGILAEHSQHEDEGSDLMSHIDSGNNGDDSNVDMESVNIPSKSLSRKSSTRSRKSSYSKSIGRSGGSSSETSPNLKPENSSGKKSGEKPATKKASHKLAEQGRRNRMNMAVHELGNLIPQTYHDEVTIPSKATTVELASKYIRALLTEIDEMKRK